MENITNEIGIANVEIILEQEASSLTMLYDNNINKKYLHENENFILIDLGSSSVDICVNKIIKNNNLKQLLQPSSFRYGSNQINSKIIEIIEFVWGKEKINEFKNMNFDGWQTTLDDIEKKKKEIDNNNEGDITILTPFNNKERKWWEPPQGFKGKYNNIEISFTSEYINIPSNLFKTIINDNVSKIIGEINKIIKKINEMNEKIRLILFTGGFSSSKILQNSIKNAFNKSYIIYFSKNPNETIMKGAAIYGLKPNSISFRVSPVTIGIGIYKDFNENKGTCEKQMNIEGELFCFEIITFIQKGKTIKNNSIIKKKIIPWYKDKINVELFSTFNEDFSKNEYNKLGDIELKFIGNDLPLKNRDIEISLKFSNYITVSLLDKTYKNYKSEEFYYPS